MRFPPFKVVVKEGCTIPKWYGPAYYVDVMKCNDRVFMPFPIFWIVWFWNERLRWWLLRPSLKRSRWENQRNRYGNALAEIWEILEVNDYSYSLSEVEEELRRIREITRKAIFED